MSIELGQFEFEDLSAYLDGELPPERAERVRRLLARGPGLATGEARPRGAGCSYGLVG